MTENGPEPEPEARSNRLATEASPYLLQHAQNPVDWYPWCEEAFERARVQDRPIFLSIGYATCHWCHVMEHESFEDLDVAELLNNRFISIKVDREERPDIDGVYMTVCQLMTGQGGWPLTVVMTPDKQPFFAGTYFPRESGPGRIGMLELLPRLSGLWTERRADVEASGAAALEAVREVERRGLAGDGERLDETTLKRGFDELYTRFDRHQGGFGSAPKFPTPHQLLFLLRWSDRTGDARGLDMVEKTLIAMRRGGIFDHLGFGFHRYSTDARWLVPHFEKMLYDQAMLAMAYVELWQVTRDDVHRRVAEEIFAYVARDLTDREGAFYSAEDADSEGREGAFYLWTREELDSTLHDALGEGNAELVGRALHVEERGNFADEATGLRTGENILHMRESLDDLADALGEDPAALEGRLERAREALFARRLDRPRPLLDDKILTDWNGLMIAALAMAGRAFDEPSHTEAGARAARFILDRMRDADGCLLHRYREGDAAIRAGAADHAFLIWGLTELYAATFAVEWLEAAMGLLSDLLDRFWDPEAPGVFASDESATDVPVRQKEVYDGATPSANAVTWYVLLRLSQLTGDERLLERASSLAGALAVPVQRSPSAHTMSLVALDIALGPANEIVIAGDPAGDDTRTLLSALAQEFRPRTGVLLRPPEDHADAERVTAIAPFSAAYQPTNGRAAAYVCSGFVCQRPSHDASEMIGLLG